MARSYGGMVGLRASRWGCSDCNDYSRTPKNRVVRNARMVPRSVSQRVAVDLILSHRSCVPKCLRTRGEVESSFVEFVLKPPYVAQAIGSPQIQLGSPDYFQPTGYHVAIVKYSPYRLCLAAESFLAQLWVAIGGSSKRVPKKHFQLRSKLDRGTSTVGERCTHSSVDYVDQLFKPKLTLVLFSRSETCFACLDPEPYSSLPLLCVSTRHWKAFF